MSSERIIYVGDPMCSWCWGIAPELDRLMQWTTIPFSVVVGGLRPGDSAEQMRPSMQQFLAEHWRHVEERSGQPFDHSILADHSWTYDTDPACRAVVTMRRTRPEGTWRFFKRIQRAFYAEATIVSEFERLRPLLDGFEVDEDRFMTDLASQDVAKETWQDYAWARSVGINAFPVVVLRTEDALRPLAMGWTSARDMSERLVGALPEPVAGATCRIGEPC